MCAGDEVALEEFALNYSLSQFKCVTSNSGALGPRQERMGPFYCPVCAHRPAPLDHQRIVSTVIVCVCVCVCPLSLTPPFCLPLSLSYLTLLILPGVWLCGSEKNTHDRFAGFVTE